MSAALRASSAGGREQTLSPPPAAASEGGPAGPVRDLLAAWRPGDFLMERWGGGLLATGVARRIEVPSGEDLPLRAARLAGAALAGSGGGAATVVGALPFGAEIPAELIVPARAVSSPGAEDRPPGAGPAASVNAGAVPPRRRSSLPPATPIPWRAAPSPEQFAGILGEAIGRIGAGELEKVVLTRALAGPNPGVDARALLAALRAADPGAHLFAAAAGPGRVFMGATPETLIRRTGRAVLSVPHAGTAPRFADPARDREAAADLLRSAKERHEHAVVVEAVADRLAPFCGELRVDPEPHLTATSAVWHLASRVRGRLRGSPGALDLAAALHPTPAVCGTPTAAALDLISELEPASRGLYAGLVGWMDARGDGEWAVSIRCALLSPTELLLHAGVGIVAESDPEAEVAETESKFRTLLDALRTLGLG